MTALCAIRANSLITWGGYGELAVSRDLVIGNRSFPYECHSGAEGLELVAQCELHDAR